MGKLLSIAGIFFIVSGCKKAHSSYWQVNNESFSTDKVTFSCSPGGASLSSLSEENGFSIVFIPGSDKLPRSGSCKIEMPYPGSGGAQVTFYYQGRAYGFPSNPGSTVLQFSASGKKSILTIEPTWLKQSTVAKDSILVQGKLSEP